MMQRKLHYMKRSLKLLKVSAKVRPAFTLGVKAHMEPKSSIPIGAKVEISPKGFTLGVKKAEIEKNIFNLPPRY
jgi:hypothetical protein